MKRFALLAACLVLALPVATTADDAKKDLDKFQGTWNAVSYEIAGTKIEGDDLKAVVSAVIIKDTAFAWKSGDISEEKGFVKIDAAQNPKHIDFVHESEGGTKITMWTGIYSLDGDTFKLCVHSGMGNRPKDFSTMNVTYGVFTFKRAK